MFKIEIISNKTNQKWGATFKNLPELEEWQLYHVNANTWGLPQREVRKKISDTENEGSFVYHGGYYDDIDVISESEKEVIGNTGVIVTPEMVLPEGTITVFKEFVLLRCEYSITISDLIEDEKKSKLEILSKNTDELLNTYRGYVTINGIKWDSGKRYEENIVKTLKENDKGILSFPVTWLDYDNIPHSLSRIELEEILNSIESDMYAKGNLAYQTKWSKRNSILAATNSEELDLIDLEIRI